MRNAELTETSERCLAAGLAPRVSNQYRLPSPILSRTLLPLPNERTAPHSRRTAALDARGHHASWRSRRGNRVRRSAPADRPRSRTGGARSHSFPGAHGDRAPADLPSRLFRPAAGMSARGILGPGGGARKRALRRLRGRLFEGTSLAELYARTAGNETSGIPGRDAAPRGGRDGPAR